MILSRKKDGRFSSSSFHRSGITRQEVKEGIVGGYGRMGIDRKKGKKNEMWILRRVKWDKVCGGGMGQKLTWWGSNSYLRNAISMWCGVCEQGYRRKAGRQRER